MGAEYARSDFLKSHLDKIRIRHLFYKLASDVTFVFENGERIQANKTILAMHSVVFQQMFFGKLKEKDNIRIRDTKSRHFQLFLDCLMGFENVDSESALKVYPIADKYDAQNLKTKCEICLSKSEITENVANVLDLGVIYNSDLLVESCVDLIKRRGARCYFSDPNHYYLLSPRSVEALLTHFPANNLLMHSFLFDWATNYVTENDVHLNVRQFLEKTGIWPKMSVEDFSMVDLINYYQTEHVKNIYTENERIRNFQKVCSQKLDIYMESPLRKINKSDEITEYYRLDKPNDMDLVRLVVYLNGRAPLKKNCKYREHITCKVAISYFDIENKRRELSCRSECKRKINYASEIRFKFKEILDGSLIKKFDDIKITYKFHISGVYLRSLPSEVEQILAICNFQHTRSVSLTNTVKDNAKN